MVKVEAGVGVEVEVQGTGGEGEGAALVAAMVAAEGVRQKEVEDLLVAALVDVAGVVTSISGKRTSERFTPLSSRKRRTK